MSIASELSRYSYAGNGSTTVFAFPQPFQLEADLVVMEITDSTGSETLKTLTTHYTVTGEGGDSGGSVTMLVAPAAGKTLLIYRDPAMTQTLELDENEALPVNELEKRLDKLTQISQRIQDQFNRTLQLPEGFTDTFNPKLSGLVTGDTVVVVKTAGDGIELVEFTEFVGDTGATGPQGAQGDPGPQGDPGAQGDPGEGVPTGGTAGQVLAKIDGTNYNTEWVDPATGSGVPTGGTTGQVLKKQSNTDGDADWEDEAAGGPADTDALSEGSTNLYFTEARVLGTDIAGYTSGAGTVAATDTVLQAIQKLNGNEAAHLADATDAHAASAVSNSPTGNLAATTVQGALDELQTDVDTRQLRSTLTTKGDIYVATGSGTTTRLQAGTDGYALVTDSAQATGLKYVATSFTAPNSSVIFDTGISSNGSTNTTCRRFANVSTAGSGLTATQSSTLGDYVTVNENGNFTISYTEVCTGVGGNYFAITKNGSALSSGPETITYAQGFLAGNYTGSDEMIFVGSVTVPLIIGDVIRFQRVNARISTSSRVIGIVTQVTK